MQADIPAIEKNSSIPYYRQLADILRRQIEEGFYREGEQLPSEVSLGEQYGVNRHTVRQAVNALSGLCFVYKLKGRGTFVARRDSSYVHYKVDRRSRFSDNILRMGLTPGAKILKAAETAAPDFVADCLELEPGEPVVTLELVRYVDGQPFCATTTYFSAKYVPGLAERLKGFTSLYRIIEEDYNILPSKAQSVFYAALPSPEDATTLNIPQNMPILKVESLMRTSSEVPVQYDIVRYRGDRGKIIVNFQSGPGGD